MKVSELIKALKALPQGIDVEFVDERERTFDIDKVECQECAGGFNSEVVYLIGKANC